MKFSIQINNAKIGFEGQIKTFYNCKQRKFVKINVVIANSECFLKTEMNFVTI